MKRIKDFAVAERGEALILIYSRVYYPINYNKLIKPINN